MKSIEQLKQSRVESLLTQKKIDEKMISNDSEFTESAIIRLQKNVENINKALANFDEFFQRDIAYSIRNAINAIVGKLDAPKGRIPGAIEWFIENSSPVNMCNLGLTPSDITEKGFYLDETLRLHTDEVVQALYEQCGFKDILPTDREIEELSRKLDESHSFSPEYDQYLEKLRLANLRRGYGMWNGLSFENFTLFSEIDPNFSKKIEEVETQNESLIQPQEPIIAEYQEVEEEKELINPMANLSDEEIEVQMAQLRQEMERRNQLNNSSEFQR